MKSLIALCSELLMLAVLNIGFAGNATETCAVSADRLEKNKQLVRDFFLSSAPLEERATTFLTRDYVQHNPRLLRIGEVIHKSGRDLWSAGITTAQREGISIIDAPGSWNPQPVILMAECDLVTAIYEGSFADPDSTNRTYHAYAFETFRVRHGKLAEHWDHIQLHPGWEGSSKLLRQSDPAGPAPGSVRTMTSDAARKHATP